MVVIVIIACIRDWYNDKQLAGKTIETIAIVTDITSGTGVRQIAGVNYEYQINGKTYTGSDNGNFNFMKIGDTLLVVYAISDRSVSKVKEKYYMLKYKRLKE